MEIGNLWHEVKAKMDAYEGKEIPADVVAEVDAMLDAMDVKKQELDTRARYTDFARLATEADESKRLPNPAVESKAVEPSADIERKAFASVMRGRRYEFLAPELKAALNVTTAGEGGYLTPVLYYNDLIAALTKGSVLRQAGARVISLPGSESVKFPSLTNSTRAIKTAEAAAYNEVEPTVGEITFTPVKFTRLVKASKEILTDSRIDLVGQIIMPDVQNAFILAENADFTTGDGVGDPQGVVTGATAAVTAAAATAITADELMDLQYSLEYMYRPRAKFMMHDSTVKAIRKLKTGIGGDNTYLWSPGLSANEPSTLLGSPVIVNNDMAQLAGVSAKTVVYGDFSYFWIADFGGLEIQPLMELYMGTGQVGWACDKRMDSRVMLATAFQLLTQAAA
jgi:HK97 family phage major capsid protein